MKRILSVLLVCVMLLALGALAVSADEPIYVFNVKAVNGTIGGEDAVICTTQDAYDNCNPKWAITVLCEIVSDNVILVKEDAIAGSGSVPSVTVGDGVVALVVHSSTSDTAQAETYPNVFAKNAALAATAGQYLILEGLDLEAGTGAGTATLVVKLPDDISVDEPVESSEEPAESATESTEEPATESSEEPAAASSEEPAAESGTESAAPAESTEESKEEDGGLSAGTIALIVAAAVVVIAVIVFFALKAKKK